MLLSIVRDCKKRLALENDRMIKARQQQRDHTTGIPLIAGSFIFAVSILLSACGGGAGTETNGNIISGSGSSTEVAAATEDVQRFKLNFWDKAKRTDRCGQCHNAGGQSPEFARSDDVNLAYADAIKYANFSSAADSTFVTKVGGGHNCWETVNAVCADNITKWIQAWAGSNASVSSKKIVLKAPPIKDPGTTKNFPVSSASFAGVHTLLKAHCANCHTDNSSTPRAPYFAQDDIDKAYEEVKTKIDLNNTTNSRLYVRLNSEFHNCWSGTCTDDAAEMLAAINAMAGSISTAAIDPSLVTSKVLKLTDGIIASGGSRHEANLIALYEFKTGTGNTAYDTSGVEPPLNLSLAGNTGWVGGYGVEFKDSTARAQGTTATSKKLYDFIQAAGEYSVEGWIIPNNVAQMNATIISYSASKTARNFTLAQNQYQAVFRNRASTTDANGDTALITASADEDLQASLQHVVLTYDPVRGRRIYVNGVFTDDADPVSAGTLNSWNDSYVFLLGSEAGNENTWKGQVRMVAIHNRALTQEQITQNFKAGVGEKYYLLFSVAHLTGIADSYVYFEVSQFDSYSYLFNKPTFIILNASATPSNIAIKGLRIGVNGKEADVGQAYLNINTTLSTANGYNSDTGQLLSSVGTVIPVDQGSSNDEFFISFEVLGGNSKTYTETIPTAPTPVDLVAVSDIGLRTFEEINASLSSLTGVPVTQTNVDTVYKKVKQQLPSSEDINTFLSSNQIGIAQLAGEYCSALVDNDTLRSSFFPGVDFTEAYGNFTTAAVGGTTKQDNIITPILDKLIGSNNLTPDLATQPLLADMRTELRSLIDTLATCSGGCDTTNRTRSLAKAACTATYGTAAMLIQ